MEDRGDVSVTGVFEERRTHEAATLTWLALFCTIEIKFHTKLMKIMIRNCHASIVRGGRN